MKNKGFILIDSCMVIVITSLIVLLTFAIVLIISKQNELIKAQITIIDESYKEALSNIDTCIIYVKEDEEEIIEQ